MIEPLRALPVVLISLFVVVGAVDILIALQPSIMQSLRTALQGPPNAGGTSSTLATAALIVGGVALAATTLTVFIRGVRSAPYLCITPVWVCACMLAIARLQIQLPLPVPTAAFVAVSALLFVGSGVLFETTSRMSNLIGTALSLLPLTLLSIGYALTTNTHATFDADAMLMLFVLTLAAAGAPAIAIACRANGAKVFGGSMPATEAMSAQLVELLERARMSEERAVRAERQLMSGGLQLAAASGPRLTVDDDELALMRPRATQSWHGWAAAAVLLAVALGGYAFAYAPLKGEITSLLQSNHRQTEQHAAALATLRTDFARQRTELEQKFAAATEPPAATPEPSAAEPPAKAPKALAIPRTESQDSEASDSAPSEASADREARRAARIARHEEAKAERAARAEERRAHYAEARESRAAEREAARAEREQHAADRSAARAEAKARRDASSESSDEPEVSKPAKHAAVVAPPAPERDVPKASDELRDTSSNDDPLEGL
jgi:hypothetical protein